MVVHVEEFLIVVHATLNGDLIAPCLTEIRGLEEFDIA